MPRSTSPTRCEEPKIQTDASSCYLWTETVESLDGVYIAINPATKGGSVSLAPAHRDTVNISAPGGCRLSAFSTSLSPPLTSGTSCKHAIRWHRKEPKKGITTSARRDSHPAWNHGIMECQSVSREGSGIVTHDRMIDRCYDSEVVQSSGYLEVIE